MATPGGSGCRGFELVLGDFVATGRQRAVDDASDVLVERGVGHHALRQLVLVLGAGRR